jgi:hypothetical protein
MGYAALTSGGNNPIHDVREVIDGNPGILHSGTVLAGTPDAFVFHTMNTGTVPVAAWPCKPDCRMGAEKELSDTDGGFS